MGAAYGLRACFGQAEVLHFALLNEIPDRAGDVFDWYIRVNAMLIEQIDNIRSDDRASMVEAGSLDNKRLLFEWAYMGNS